MTSNREHDDSVFRIFTCFCGRGWESSSKPDMQVRCVLGCSNSKTLQEELLFIPYHFKERQSSVLSISNLPTISTLARKEHKHGDND